MSLSKEDVRELGAILAARLNSDKRGILMQLQPRERVRLAWSSSWSKSKKAAAWKKHTKHQCVFYPD